MRNLPATLEAALASGVTTLVHCWLLTRSDGLELGFTDHDRDLVIAGKTFEAASGLDASASETALGLAVGGGEVSGTLSSARIDPKDIEGGLYDGARLESWLVDWNAPDLDYRIEVSTFGEIRHSERGFIAETRNAFHRLDQESGRLYTSACHADFGDARCGVDPANPLYRINGVIGATDGARQMTVSALVASAIGLFTRGQIRFTGGLNMGARAVIKEHLPGGSLVLWQAPAHPLLPGDTIEASAGCDKQFATCRDRFANALRFRGFPYIPAPEIVMLYARPGEGTHLGRPLIP